MHIIEPLAIKTSDNIHYIAEYNRSMKCPWLRSFANAINLSPFSLIDIKLINVVKSLLIGVNTSENVDVASADHG